MVRQSPEQPEDVWSKFIAHLQPVGIGMFDHPRYSSLALAVVRKQRNQHPEQIGAAELSIASTTCYSLVEPALLLLRSRMARLATSWFDVRSPATRIRILDIPLARHARCREPPHRMAFIEPGAAGHFRPRHRSRTKCYAVSQLIRNRLTCAINTHVAIRRCIR